MFLFSTHFNPKKKMTNALNDEETRERSENCYPYQLWI